MFTSTCCIKYTITGHPRKQHVHYSSAHRNTISFTMGEKKTDHCELMWQHRDLSRRCVVSLSQHLGKLVFSCKQWVWARIMTLLLWTRTVQHGDSITSDLNPPLPYVLLKVQLIVADLAKILCNIESPAFHPLVGWLMKELHVLMDEKHLAQLHQLYRDVQGYWDHHLHTQTTHNHNVLMLCLPYRLYYIKLLHLSIPGAFLYCNMKWGPDL